MSGMKCPICQNNLHKINMVVSTCTNDKCKLWGSSIPNLVLEALAQTKQDLECTRKALNDANEKLRHCVNITLEELDELKGNLLIAQDALLHFSKDPIVNKALEQITTPKRKDS